MSVPLQRSRSSILFSNYEFRYTFKSSEKPSPSIPVYISHVYTTGVDVIRTWRVCVYPEVKQSTKASQCNIKIELKKISGPRCKAEIWLECCKGGIFSDRTKEQNEFSDGESFHSFDTRKFSKHNREVSYSIRLLLRLPEDDRIPYATRLDGLHKLGSDTRNMLRDNSKDFLIRIERNKGIKDKDPIEDTPVHKLIASACSEKIYKLLKGNPKCDLGVILLDIDLMILHGAILYMYTGFIQRVIAENLQYFLELYRLASNIEMLSLVQNMKYRLCRLLNPDNVLYVMKFACKNKFDFLFIVAESYVAINLAQQEAKFLPYIKKFDPDLKLWREIKRSKRTRVGNSEVISSGKSIGVAFRSRLGVEEDKEIIIKL